jgi:hypothetical protein
VLCTENFEYGTEEEMFDRQDLFLKFNPARRLGALVGGSHDDHSNYQQEHGHDIFLIIHDHLQERPTPLQKQFLKFPCVFLFFTFEVSFELSCFFNPPHLNRPIEILCFQKSVTSLCEPLSWHQLFFD